MHNSQVALIRKTDIVMTLHDTEVMMGDKQNLTPLCTFPHAVHNRVARCVGSRGWDFHKPSLNTGQCKLEYLS
jgi:hypothetical protein